MNTNFSSIYFANSMNNFNRSFISSTAQLTTIQVQEALDQVDGVLEALDLVEEEAQVEVVVALVVEVGN